VLLAPAILLQWDVLNAGVGSVDDDLLFASALAGAAQVAITLGRTRAIRSTATHLMPLVVASLDALVVLALSGSLLVLGVLYWFPDEHASLATHGYPLVLLWGGFQLLAVVLAEVTARALLRWLDPAPDS
jgi:hypothetical protein